MLANATIEAPSSKYSSPVVLVMKKHGKYSFCVDFRRLNSVAEDSAQPMPLINQLLKEIGGGGIYTTLDGKYMDW